MISECTQNDTSDILNVINDAALKYKGIIPDYCWRDPYMLKKELVFEFTKGLRMFGYKKSNKFTKYRK